MQEEEQRQQEIYAQKQEEMFRNAREEMQKELNSGASYCGAHQDFAGTNPFARQDDSTRFQAMEQQINQKAMELTRTHM